MARKRHESVAVPTVSEAFPSEEDAQPGVIGHRPRHRGRQWSWSYLLLILCPALCADAFWITFHPLTGLFLLICFSLLSAAAIARADAQPVTGAGNANDAPSAVWRGNGEAAFDLNEDLDLPERHHRCETCANIAELIAIMGRVATIFWAALLTGPLIVIWSIIAVAVFDPNFEIDLSAGAALGAALRLILILLSFSAFLAQILALTSNRGGYRQAPSCPLWAPYDCSDSHALLLPGTGNDFSKQSAAINPRICLYRVAKSLAARATQHNPDFQPRTPMLSDIRAYAITSLRPLPEVQRSRPSDELLFRRGRPPLIVYS